MENVRKKIKIDKANTQIPPIDFCYQIYLLANSLTPEE